MTMDAPCTGAVSAWGPARSLARPAASLCLRGCLLPSRGVRTQGLRVPSQAEPQGLEQSPYWSHSC